MDLQILTELWIYGFWHLTTDLRISGFLITQHEERPLNHYGNFSLLLVLRTILYLEYSHHEIHIKQQRVFITEKN